MFSNLHIINYGGRIHMKHAGSSAANKIVPIVNVQDSEKLVIQKILVIVPLQKNQTNKHQQKKTMLLVLVEK